MIRTVVEDSTITAGTLSSAPLVTTVALGELSILRQVRYQFPPGPSGFVGWRLKYAGSVILPFQQNAWVRGDSMTRDLPLMMEIPSGRVVLERYNTDRYDHAVLFIFEVEDQDISRPFTSAFIPAGMIEGANL